MFPLCCRPFVSYSSLWPSEKATRWVLVFFLNCCLLSARDKTFTPANVSVCFELCEHRSSVVGLFVFLNLDQQGTVSCKFFDSLHFKQSSLHLCQTIPWFQSVGKFQEWYVCGVCACFYKFKPTKTSWCAAEEGRSSRVSLILLFLLQLVYLSWDFLSPLNSIATFDMTGNKFHSVIFDPELHSDSSFRLKSSNPFLATALLTPFFHNIPWILLVHFTTCFWPIYVLRSMQWAVLFNSPNCLAFMVKSQLFVSKSGFC